MKKIKSLPKHERPQEKLIAYGPERLTNHELLAIFLRTGTYNTDVLVVARRILRHFSSASLTSATVQDLTTFTGVGVAKAAQIVACFELGKRLLHNKKSRLLLRPIDVYNALQDIRMRKKEYFVVFYLDTRHQEVQKEIISVGTLTESVIHPREVFESAIAHSTAQIIIAHNHPSGDPEPSQQDVVVTSRLVAAGKILGIEVLDHVIVTKKDFISLREKKLL